MDLKGKRLRGRPKLDVINSDVKTTGVCIDDVGEKGVPKKGGERSSRYPFFFFCYHNIIWYNWIYNLIVDLIFED